MLNFFALLPKALLSIAVAATATAATAAPLYFNGFETNTAAWTNATRVASGTGGVTSAAGGFHATSSTSPTAFTTFGGYNFGAGNGVPTAFQPYITSIDIFLNVGGDYANNTRFDFSSAINNANGTFLKDFIFNAGFYNDATGPGAGTSRFVISASNNSQPNNAYAKNPDRGPIAISTTGWYTFQHSFYASAGVLAVDMSIFDAADALVNSWTLSSPANLIAGVGGNRYGWFAYNQIAGLAFDNAQLETTPAAAVPEPATVLLFGAGLLGLAVSRRRRP